MRGRGQKFEEEEGGKGRHLPPTARQRSIPVPKCRMLLFDDDKECRSVKDWSIC
jgi:hypothetical protein